MGFTKTPLLACLILVFLTLMIRIFISFISSKWMSYLVLLLFLGGMIVLFVYICTLISKIKVLIKTLYKKYFYRACIFILFLFVTIYLLLILIISIKIIQKHKGGLKSKTYA